jgi:hypothetical protein
VTDPQNPWQNQDNVQWQNPAGAYPATPPAPQPFGQYQVNHVGQASFSMAPLPPVLPQELAPPRPATVTAAMWIWIAGAVLAIAVIPVLLLGNTASIAADLRASSDPSVSEGPELAVQIWAVLAGFGMFVAAAPYIAFAIVMRNGHNWARILLTILGVLGFMSMIAIVLIGLQAPVWQAGVAIGIVVIGLIIAAVVLQFLPASNKYVR